MKQINLNFWVLIAASILAFNSCKKDHHPTPAAAQNISMVINDTTYNPTAFYAVYYKSVNSVVVTAKLNATSEIVLIMEPIKVGTYTINYPVLNGVTYTSGIVVGLNGVELNNAASTLSETIVVTAFTGTTITGTFQFSATIGTRTIEIKSGKFNCNYTTAQ
jgi:hypothetical protein